MDRSLIAGTLKWHATLIHVSGIFFLSFAIGVVIIGVWYPWPFYAMLGGIKLILLIMAVNMVCGPLLTFILWNPAKSCKALIVDCVLIAGIQSCALGYGIFIAAQARPVYIVFEVDRFRVVRAIDVNRSDLTKAPSDLQKLPWTGPKWISIRAPRDNNELILSIDKSIAGEEPSLRPGWWQNYGLGLAELLKRARSLDELAHARPAQTAIINEAINEAGLQPSELVWLPLTNERDMKWIVLLNHRTGQPMSFAPVDGFF